MFFQGDSFSYINTALRNEIPPDRSYVYGFIIKLIAVSAHSLTSLIAFQILSSAFNAVLLSYVLKNYFSLALRPACFWGILCALEPLQLMYERYILTETLSLTLFIIYLMVIFNYLKKANLRFLLLIHIIGTGLITFRLSFLPIVLLNAIFLPILATSNLSSKNILSSLTRRSNLSSSRFPYKVFAVNLIASILVTYGLHSGYRHLTGFLIDRPPAYQYEAGFFLLAFWTPVVKPEDFPRQDLADTVFTDLKFDIKERINRGPHRWMPGGLIARIKEGFPTSEQADRVAKETAINALKRDPIGIASLAFSGFKDYWNYETLHWGIKEDRDTRKIPKDILISLRDNFSLSAEQLPFLKTFTNKYFALAWPWYLSLICLPFISIILLFICERSMRRNVFCVFFVSTVIVAMSCSLIERPTIRYLHPLGWLSFLAMGVLIEWISRKFRKNLAIPDKKYL